MLIVSRPDGWLAVTQAAHAAMAGVFADAWEEDRFPAPDRAADLRLAIREHELGWAEWDQRPELDPATGLPFTPVSLDPAVHLPMQLEGPRELARTNVYAGLLASLKHAGMYQRPKPTALIRRRHRLVRSYLRKAAEMNAELRRRVSVAGAEIERDRKLVRIWDGLSHDLLLDRAPCVRGPVPTAGEDVFHLQLVPTVRGVEMSPWPFTGSRLRVEVQGRLLRDTFTDEHAMRVALDQASAVTVGYDLWPA